MELARKANQHIKIVGNIEEVRGNFQEVMGEGAESLKCDTTEKGEHWYDRECEKAPNLETKSKNRSNESEHT